MRFLTILPTLLLVVAPQFARAQWLPDGLPIASTPQGQLSAVIAPDGFGGAVIAWSDWRVGNSDIYAQRVNASGIAQWPANGVVVSVAIKNQTDPAIFGDGSGGAIVTWEDHRSGNAEIYVQRLNPLGAPLWAFNGVALCTAAGNRMNPRIVTDGAGGAIVSWYDSRNGTYDIYAQRIISWGAPQWATDGVAIAVATGSQFSPEMVADGTGGAIITWYDSRNGPWYDIYAQRVNASGVPQWAQDGVALCTATNRQENHSAVADGLGGAIVAWRDYRNGINDIYAQRVNASGLSEWVANGVAVCTAPNGQDRPAILSDGLGGAIITWFDGRNADIDVYAQQFSAEGIAQWAPDGVALSTGMNEQSDPTIVTDGVGGAIVTWQDLRSETNFDLYAQRISNAGDLQWDVGVPVCTASNSQLDPVMISDGVGGAIVAWEDHRGGHTDVYARRIGSDGGPTSLRPTPGYPRLSIHTSYPNPFGMATLIGFELGSDSDADISVFDVRGRKVRSLARGPVRKGTHQVSFDGMDDQNQQLPSGVYFCRLTAAGETVVRKLVLTR